MPEDRPSLSVVIPAFNEAENIGKCITQARNILSPAFSPLEIIVVDDGSTDGTGALLDELAGRFPEVRVIHHDRNYKLGRTLRDGFAAANNDLIFYTDADLPVDFAEVIRGWEIMQGKNADAVIGYRLDRGGEPWYRLLYSFVYNLIVNLLFGLGVRDVNFSFKLFTKKTLRELRLTSEGSFIDAEMLARAKKAGARVVQIGMHYYPRQAGKSTLAKPNIIVKILLEMIKFYWREWLFPPAEG